MSSEAAARKKEQHPSVRRLWAAYCASVDEGAAADTPPEAWHFCDNAAEADECAALAKAGLKRATAPSLWWFEHTGTLLPQPGDLYVVTDWAGEGQCVIQTTRVEVVPFDEVSAAHACREGEGDRTLAHWRRVHWAYYHRELEGIGRAPQEDMLIVCEQFECVYPVPPAP